MIQYISKSALTEEIERRINEYNTPIDRLGSNNIRLHECKDILSFLNTLEVKEVDFKDTKSVFEGQYLSKDKIVLTIERLQDECEEQGDNNGVELLEKLFNKLDILEVKENDLVEEFNYDDYITFFKEHPDYNDCSWGFEETWTFAQYCYKLGLKAQKKY